MIAKVGAALAAVVLLVAPAVGAGAAVAQTPPVPPAPTPPAVAKAFVVVDVGSGQVLAEHDDRTPVRVASTFKLLTALIARERVPFDTPVTISPRAANLPALNINAKAGQVWKASDLFECLFLISANDAAMALAEQAGPNILNFQLRMVDMARRLHLADHPTMRDPAGLDDTYSFAGGNLMSARDLAIVARAVLADPVLAGFARQREFTFKGGDGLDHRIVNHNHFLQRYPGAIGLKTGYTRQAGHTLVAVATRGGRTLMAVVLDAPDTVGVASSLLDLGWFAPGSPSDDRLPAVPERPSAAGGATTTTSRPASASSGGSGAAGDAPRAASSSRMRPPTGWLVSGGVAVGAVAAAGAAVFTRRRRRFVAAGPLDRRPGGSRRQRRRARRRRRRNG